MIMNEIHWFYLNLIEDLLDLCKTVASNIRKNTTATYTHKTRYTKQK